MNHKRQKSGKDKPRLGWDTEGRRFLRQRQDAVMRAEVQDVFRVPAAGDRQRESATATV